MEAEKSKLKTANWLLTRLFSLFDSTKHDQWHWDEFTHLVFKIKASPGCGSADITFLHWDIRHEVTVKSPWGRNHALFWSFSEQLAKEKNRYSLIRTSDNEDFCEAFLFSCTVIFKAAQFLLTSEH